MPRTHHSVLGYWEPATSIAGRVYHRAGRAAQRATIAEFTGSQQALLEPSTSASMV
jgi:hypothetical protein